MYEHKEPMANVEEPRHISSNHSLISDSAGRAVACAYYCVTRAILRTGGLIHLISGGNLLGSHVVISLLLLMMIL